MKKILKQSFPFVSPKSQSVYRLVEVDGACQVEKVTTSVSVEKEISESDDPHQIFSDFLATKQENREKNKKRIGTKEAFQLHYAHGMTWREIADEVGQKSKGSIASRVADFTRSLAYEYMSGTDMYILGKHVDLSPNHLHQILSTCLEGIREQRLFDYEERSVMNNFSSDVSLVMEITKFLSDADSFRYQFVDPLDQALALHDGKLALYTEDFYEFEYASGKKSRIRTQAFEHLMYGGLNIEQLVKIIGVNEIDDIVSIVDMFGEPSNYLVSIFKPKTV